MTKRLQDYSPYHHSPAISPAFSTGEAIHVKGAPPGDIKMSLSALKSRNADRLILETQPDLSRKKFRESRSRVCDQKVT
jgi:hypothetical protein